MSRPAAAARIGGGRYAVALLAVALLASTFSAAAVPGRVASLNLCTDSMLLELADPHQIASVTALSRDPALSYYAARAEGLAVNHGLAEEMIALAPDLILAGRHTTGATNRLLTELGYRVETFVPPTTLGEFKTAFLRLAELLGKTPRAAALLRDFDARLRAALGSSQPAIRTIVYQANAYTPGRTTLADDLLALAGMRNVALELGLDDGGFVPLEQLIAAAPDLLVIGEALARDPALAMEFLDHPALRAGRRRLQRVEIPERLWGCGGTYLAEAVELLLAGAERGE